MPLQLGSRYAAGQFVAVLLPMASGLALSLTVVELATLAWLATPDGCHWC